MNEAMNKAIELSKLGIESYPIVPGGRTPYKGSNGQKDASMDIEQLKKIFKPNDNVNINLATSSLLVLDVDRHTKGENGLDALGELVKQQGDFYGDTYWEATPRNGVHFFFRTNGEKLNSKTDLKNGLEIITDQISISPSVNQFGKYEPSKEKTFENIQPAPQWLIDMATETFISTNVKPIKKRAGAYLLELMYNGTIKGNRNNYMTRLIGRFLGDGTDINVAYDFATVVNERYLDQPLSDKELNSIFKSIIRREKQRRGVHGG
ncbi:bifunctional DNA primase/polymerase [Pediococcus argentinicus]|uniref:bifunctional DNA primase/polymerase n=1 Tax=Pediococcus argentinicus TaxID=480391 RepID=UPI00338D7BA5